MSGLYVQLKRHIGAFAVIYGIFLSFGELGPGNCLGLLAAAKVLDPLPLVDSSTASLPRLARLVPSQALGVRYISPLGLSFVLNGLFLRTAFPGDHRRCGIIFHWKRVT